MVLSIWRSWATTSVPQGASAILEPSPEITAQIAGESRSKRRFSAPSRSPAARSSASGLRLKAAFAALRSRGKRAADFGPIREQKPDVAAATLPSRPRRFRAALLQQKHPRVRMLPRRQCSSQMDRDSIEGQQGLSDFADCPLRHRQSPPIETKQRIRSPIRSRRL